jgi:helicase MOV-10
VAITRAQSLLIMIGDPAALGKDEFWRTFINYVRSNKGSIGKEPSWKADEEVPVPVREIVQRSGGVVYGNEFINGKSDRIYRFYFGDE